MDHDLNANPLYHHFSHNEGRLIHKWIHYFAIYHQHLSRWQGQDVVFLEFGVSHGGSLQMWKKYFGSGSTIIGVDIDPRCRALEEDRVLVRIGDQEDRIFLRELVAEFGRLDVVLDDGGHTMPQQINTFEEVFPAVSPDGLYMVEDLLTSYRPNYNGGLRKPGTFIEYAKGLIDQLHAWHSHEKGFEPGPFTRSAHGLHFYDSILVIEKRPIAPPRHEKTGKPSF
jgi:cephalosporin hydroxylase